MATTTFNIDLKKKTKNIKKNVKSINEKTLSLTEDVVEGTITAGAKWQKVLAKAMKSSVVLLGNQQEMALDAIEALKDQYQYGSKRVKKLISLTPEVKKVVNKVDLPTKREVTSKVTKTVKAVTGNVALKSKSVKKAVASKKITVRNTETVKTKTVKKDDLTVIDGVGKKIESILNDAGVRTYRQLANMDLRSLRTIIKSAGPSYQMHNPTPWRKEAKALVAAK